MLIVLAKAQVGEAALEAAKAVIADMVAASNAEEGCITYAFTQDLVQPGIIHIVEKWTDEAALAAHFATPHMAAFGAGIAGLDFKVIEALKFHTDEGLPVM
ncbi:MAG: putative quinol monooxygenase [Erythrobacter sp.]